MLTGYILLAVQDPEPLLQEIETPPNMLMIAQPSIRQALQAAFDVVPAVVLFEHTLPDGHGFELVMALKRHPRLRQVPIILMGTDDLLYYQRLGITRSVSATAEPGQINHVLAEVLTSQGNYQQEFRLVLSGTSFTRKTG